MKRMCSHPQFLQCSKAGKLSEPVAREQQLLQVPAFVQRRQVSDLVAVKVQQPQGSKVLEGARWGKEGGGRQVEVRRSCRQLHTMHTGSPGVCITITTQFSLWTSHLALVDL